MKMIRPWKTIASSSFLRVALLSAVLSSIGGLIVWDYNRVNRDFDQLKALLTDVRCQAIGQQQVLVARFAGDSVSITDNDTGTVINTLVIPTMNNRIRLWFASLTQSILIRYIQEAKLFGNLNMSILKKIGKFNFRRSLK